jgi:hypothetical protein
MLYPEKRSCLPVNGEEMPAAFAKVFTRASLSTFLNGLFTSTVRALMMPFFLT